MPKLLKIWQALFLGHFLIITEWTWGFFPKICNLTPPSPPLHLQLVVKCMVLKTATFSKITSQLHEQKPWKVSFEEQIADVKSVPNLMTTFFKQLHRLYPLIMAEDFTTVNTFLSLVMTLKSMKAQQIWSSIHKRYKKSVSLDLLKSRCKQWSSLQYSCKGLYIFCVEGMIFETKHSRMDQVKFVEDSLQKIWRDMVCLSIKFHL